MRYLRLIGHFIGIAFQELLAYRANFWSSLLYSLLNLVSGVLGVSVIFSQVEAVHGWRLESALALLGVYLTLGALRGLFFGPSLESLAGIDGEIWMGKFDYTLLRPINLQFLVSTRHWHPLSLIDLALGLGVLGVAAARLGQTLTPLRLAAFLVALAAGLTILYALLLAFAAMVFWTTFLFTWVFDALYQMARYPVWLYPGGVRLVLTWIVPVGLMTTLPAQALAGELAPGMLAGGVALAAAMVIGASLLFRHGLRRYASASS